MEHARKPQIINVMITLVFLSGLIYGKSPENEQQAASKLQQVALFKNGLGFFVSQVTCPQDKNTFSFIPAGAASHGTFWVAYPKDIKVQSLTAKEVDTKEETEAITIAELIKANINRRVKLHFLDTELDCTIKYFADNRQQEEPSPYSPRSSIPPRRGGWPLTNASLLIIEADGREICINPNDVKKIKFFEEPAKKKFETKSKSTQLDVKLSEPKGGEKLSVSYLAKGITWVPSYMVEITDTKKASISAKAVVINEVCDLNDVTIQLVTGFPNLQFADVISPLAMKENLAQFLQSLIRRESRREDMVMSNVMAQSVRYDYDMRSREAAIPAYGAARAGMAAEDLFFYPVENVNLAKGQTGYFPLFTEQAPYQHIYKWEIPDYINEDEHYRRDQKPQEEEEIWHCIRLENTSKVPWTTAPAEILKEGFILGQDILSFTPVKGKNIVRITRAVNVKAEQLELETNRQRDAARLYGYHYDLVTVEGKLRIKNFENKAVILEITKALSGEVKTSEPEAKIESLARGLRRMNALRKLTWTIELEAGENKEIAYIYEVYIRR